MYLEACDAEVEERLRDLSRLHIMRLLEALIRHDDDPSLLRQIPVTPGAKRWVPNDLVCMVSMLAETTLRWNGFKASAALVTGMVRSESALQYLLLQLCIFVDLLVIVTWTPEDDSYKLPPRNVFSQCQVKLIHIDSGSVEFSVDSDAAARMNSEEFQDVEMRVGLDAIQHHFFESSTELTSADIFVLKTRTDAYIPKETLQHVVSLNYSVSFSFAAQPFLYRIWVPWVDALQPFYFVDDTFAGCLLDMWQLCFTYPFETAGTIGPGDTHVQRWLWPFLQWYPFVHLFQRNKFDITNRLLHNSGESYDSFVIQLSSQGRLPADVDEYLVRLIASYYNLLLTFFHVGRAGSSNGGVHLILNASALVLESDGSLYIEGVRCRPGNWGFVRTYESFSAHDESMMAGALDECFGLPADTSEGVVKLSAAAPHWARPVSSLMWLNRMRRDTPQDGLTERIVTSMNIEFYGPQHYTTSAGRWNVLEATYRDTEEVQTNWCLDVAEELRAREAGFSEGAVQVEVGEFSNWFQSNRSDRGPTDWAQCCISGRRNSSCWEAVHDVEGWPNNGELAPSRLQDLCCFPKRSYCPRWLSAAGMYSLSIFSANHPAFHQHSHEIVLGLGGAASFVTAVPYFCHATVPQREKAAFTICDQKRPHLNREVENFFIFMCSVRNLTRFFWPQRATQSRPSGRQRHLFVPRVRQRSVRISVQHST